MTALLHRLRQLDAAATPGPWSWRNDQLRPYSDQWSISPGVLIADGRCGTPGGDSIDQINADLITTLRNHLPEIIAALERVEGER